MNIFEQWIAKTFGLKDRQRQLSSGTFSCDLAELQVRELAFDVCVNMIANALGRAEVCTFSNGEPVKDLDYYMWNVQPNVNQNSTQFWHYFCRRLFTDNHALIINSRTRDGTDGYVVADSFTLPDRYPAKMNRYKNVVCGEVPYTKTFLEDEVFHIELNGINVKPVLDKICESYQGLMAAAEKSYKRGKGSQWIVHVDGTSQGDEEEENEFNKLIAEQVKPFLSADSAVLPEQDGYKYTDVSKNAVETSRDLRAMIDDIFDFTATTLHIPSVLMHGQVAGTKDAVNRWLTIGLGPLFDQIGEEITRKSYGFEEWKKGNYAQLDASAIMHFDIFDAAGAIEKLISSGLYSANDLREAVGLPKIKAAWADVHYITKNFSRLDEAAEAKGGADEE